MAHVEIKSDDKYTMATKVIVDGVDISRHIYAEGFGLVRVGEGEFQCWGVQMVVVPDSLDIDLPDAVIGAVRAERDQ